MIRNPRDWQPRLDFVGCSGSLHAPLSVKVNFSRPTVHQELPCQNHPFFGAHGHQFIVIIFIKVIIKPYYCRNSFEHIFGMFFNLRSYFSAPQSPTLRNYLKAKPIPRFLTNQFTFQKVLKQSLHIFLAILNSPPRVNSKPCKHRHFVFIEPAESKFTLYFNFASMET